MRRICVFAGTSRGVRPAYAHAARTLGRALVHRHVGLVFGGSTLGLMGVLATEVLKGGGEVIGVLPEQLVTEEAAYVGLTQFYKVGSMHERKQCMAELSDAFIALPGGFGTLDELFEMVTWTQIGLHAKPAGLLDIASYYSSLLVFVEHASAEGFIAPTWSTRLACDRRPAVLIDHLQALSDNLSSKHAVPAAAITASDESRDAARDVIKP